jgi:hypothetical protein
MKPHFEIFSPFEKGGTRGICFQYLEHAVLREKSSLAALLHFTT